MSRTPHSLLEAGMAHRYADLEIGLRWIEEDQGLDVGLRFVLSDQNVDNWVHDTVLLKIDLPTLTRKVNDAEAYAQALTAMVFSSSDIARFYAESRAMARENPIHVRLNLDAPPALHRVRWELLRDPDAGHPGYDLRTRAVLAISEDSPDFQRSRGVRSGPRVRSSSSLGRLDINRFAAGGRPLAEVDVDKERRLAESCLEGIDTVYLAGKGQATLANIARELAARQSTFATWCVTASSIPTCRWSSWSTQMAPPTQSTGDVCRR